VELLSGLPAAAADLSARLDELAQTQRAAEGELSANKEFCMALDQHVGAAQAQLRVLEATIAEQQEREGRNLQQMKQEMLEPVVQVCVQDRAGGTEFGCFAVNPATMRCHSLINHVHDVQLYSATRDPALICTCWVCHQTTSDRWTALHPR
jgi:hypothetical protein